MATNPNTLLALATYIPNSPRPNSRFFFRVSVVLHLLESWKPPGTLGQISSGSPETNRHLPSIQEPEAVTGDWEKRMRDPVNPRPLATGSPRDLADGFLRQVLRIPEPF